MNRRSAFGVFAGALFSPGVVMAKLERRERLCRGFRKMWFGCSTGSPKIADDVIQKHQEVFFRNGMFPPTMVSWRKS